MFALLVALAGSGLGAAQTPVELGRVPWLRNYDEALTLARNTKKPLLLLFQEVPG